MLKVGDKFDVYYGDDENPLKETVKYYEHLDCYYGQAYFGASIFPRMTTLEQFHTFLLNAHKTRKDIKKIVIHYSDKVNMNKEQIAAKIKEEENRLAELRKKLEENKHPQLANGMLINVDSSCYNQLVTVSYKGIISFTAVDKTTGGIICSWGDSATYDEQCKRYPTGWKIIKEHISIT